MMSIRFAVLVGLGCNLVACGGSAAGDDDTVGTSGSDIATSTAALCEGAAEHRTANIVTTIACPYEQQYANISNYGEAMDATTFYDADGIQVGTVSRSCDTWWLGTDPDGVDVIINGSTGEVRSHGIQHAGRPLSRLPAHLALPLAIHAIDE